jgi:argininosuccinate lyase
MSKTKRHASKSKANQKLWGGRFKQELNALAFDFSKSIHLDKRLYREDIAGSLAHVEMLAQRGIIAPSEASQIGRGLREIEKEIEEGIFNFENGQEDIHMAIEARLHEKIGSVAGKLHTARSRNDQVATDERLWLRAASSNTHEQFDVASTRLACTKPNSLRCCHARLHALATRTTDFAFAPPSCLHRDV